MGRGPWLHTRSRGLPFRVFCERGSSSRPLFPAYNHALTHGNTFFSCYTHSHVYRIRRSPGFSGPRGKRLAEDSMRRFAAILVQRFTSGFSRKTLFAMRHTRLAILAALFLSVVVAF